jgi:hypothetical protein
LKTRSVLSSVVPDGKVDMEEFLKFRTSVAESYFLFGQEIEDYLDEIYKHAVDYNYAYMLYRLPREERPDTYDPKKVAHNMMEALSWLTNQLPVLKEKFKK